MFCLLCMYIAYRVYNKQFVHLQLVMTLKIMNGNGPFLNANGARYWKNERWKSWQGGNLPENVKYNWTSSTWRLYGQSLHDLARMFGSAYKNESWGQWYEARSFVALISRLLGFLRLRSAQTIEPTTAWAAVSSLIVQVPGTRFFTVE